MALKLSGFTEHSYAAAMQSHAVLSGSAEHSIVSASPASPRSRGDKLTLARMTTDSVDANEVDANE